MRRSEILHLTLEREWFDEIVLGTKQVEYRKYKPYWKTRLEGRDYKLIKFRNGYARNAPEMTVEFKGLRRNGKARNADYVIDLGRVLTLKRWRAKE